MKIALPRRWFAYLVLVIMGIAAIAFIGLVAFLGTPIGEVMAEAETSLLSDAAVGVNRGPWIMFTPAGD